VSGCYATKDESNLVHIISALFIAAPFAAGSIILFISLTNERVEKYVFNYGCFSPVQSDGLVREVGAGLADEVVKV